MKSADAWDVIIAGAGPAGSTCAATLAAKGHRVLVVEKEHFPRFHVGESLIPSCNGAIESVGIAPDEQPEGTFFYKGGARFICETVDQEANFPFAEALPGPPRHSWHVERSVFDTLLRDCAVQAGATVRHGVSVDSLSIDDDAAVVQTSSGNERARFFVDATGQQRFIAKKKRAARPYRDFGKAAAFTHYEGLSDEAIEEIGPDNDLRIFMIPDGWIWTIPLPNRRISVGVVSRKQGISADTHAQCIKESKILSRWTRGATKRPPRLTSNFSYHNTCSHGARFACVGDAASFLDPIFSSGISLAMNGARALANTLDPALEQGTEGDPNLMNADFDHMNEGYRAFSMLIHRFYHTKMIHNLFLNAPKQGAMRASIIGMLAGDVWREDNEFKKMLQRSRIQV